MAGDVVVENAPPIVGNDEEAVKHSEGNGLYGEEVHGRDRFAVIAQKAAPSTSGFWIFGCAFDPARYGSFRDREAQHEQLAVNPRSATE